MKSVYPEKAEEILAQEGQVKRGIEIFLEEDLDPLAVDGDN